MPDYIESTLQHSVAQLDKDSNSSIMELCIRAIGQHLTRVSDSSQVGAMVASGNQSRLSQYIQSESMITARAELLKDIKNHGMARLRACESHNLAASCIGWFFFFCFFFVLGIFVLVRHASQCSVVGLTQK